MKNILIILTTLILSTQIQAAPQRYDFVFTGDGNPATAIGYIVLESSLIPNPTVNSNNFIPLPDPLVLDINVTVSGSASGDGTYTLVDFDQIAFATGGATLDLTTELVGQATPNGTWGTPDGNNGDFNLFGVSQQQPPPAQQATNYSSIASTQGVPLAGPPAGVFYFTLGAAGGGGEQMILSSFHPFVATAVPTLSSSILLMLSLLLFTIGLYVVRKRKKTIN